MRYCQFELEDDPDLHATVARPFSEQTQKIWMTIDVPDESTVMDAIERSGLLKTFPHIDLGTQKVGVFGKIVKPQTVLRPGDRVEIYRPITCDPQTVPRRDGQRNEV